MTPQTIGYPPGFIALFAGIALGLLLLDLFAQSTEHPVSLRRALAWSGLWIAASLGFYAYICREYGAANGALFIAGYALEKVLSIDNLIVFSAIFSSFGIAGHYRHRILTCGVIGAALFRLIFVAFGSWLYGLNVWINVLFAGIIVWTAIKMMGQHETVAIADYADHWSVRLTRKMIPVFPKIAGPRFLLRHQGRFHATPLLLCLIAIEIADVLFAFDSVPAIIAVTKQPLLVYSAMIFAILGLRSLYFVLEGLRRYLQRLDDAVVILLFFIAAKLGLDAANEIAGWPGWTLSPGLSLAVVMGVLSLGVIASLLFPKHRPGDN